MNTYLISQSVNQEDDVYASAVVVAISQEAAAFMHPSGATESSEESWCKPDEVLVQHIGKSQIGHPCVLCASRY